MTDALWYLARGTGTASLLMLTVVVALGVGARSGRAVFGLPRFAVAAVHRNASLLAVALLAIHVIALLFDPYAQLKVLDLVVPFTATYRPLWVGLGTLALDLILAIIVTSLLRHRLGARSWRLIHWAAYAAWPAALFHSIFSGTDSSQWWLQTIAIACVLTVIAAGSWRLSNRFTEHRLEARR